ncbi:MAG: long-chain fatty acid--CoA ligase [Bacteroidales bacterium]|nr:long-chain fatty acid--CoA ligase [Bacteroidales bacterium]
MAVYAGSFADNHALPALTDYISGRTLTYLDVARRIARLHLFFELAGIKRGDKIALLGKNTPNWVITFMGTITYGAVIVPVLPDFNPSDAENIIDHSDAVALFVADDIYSHLNFEAMPKLRVVVSLVSRTVLAEREVPREEGKRRPVSHRSIVVNLTRRLKERYPEGFAPSDITYRSIPGGSVAVINYTSGTTGFSKGVMLTIDNLRGNVVFGIRSKLHYQGSRALSFLPLSHAYGCAFDMLVPLAVGSHITLLGKTPTPQILLKALKQVRPSLIACVPLILEKIYRKVVVPLITRKPIRWVLAVPMLDKAIYSMIRTKLVDAFGGSFEEVIVGGAALNYEVEEFLHKIHFPLTVGYGMTECGPLISYSPWRRFALGSSGRTLNHIMEAKIVPDSSLGLSPEGTPQGEIVVRGLNVMAGYYKNPEATEAVLEPDGWLHTGDMGWLGAPNSRTVYIRGRYKTMILTANGQNIYPEEIEAKLNNMPYVNECIVIEREGRLIALCFPEADELERDGIDTPEKLAELMEANRRNLNALVAPYEQVQSIEIVNEEFQKTPKRSIRRFLYK